MISLEHLSSLQAGPLLYVALAALVVASSIPIVGALFPAEPVLMAIVALAADDWGSITALLGTTAGASVLGDILSYALGRWFGPTLLKPRVVRRFRRRIVTVRRGIRRKGTLRVLVLQRWVPPTRGLVPMLLGVAEHPFAAFAGCSATAAAVWAFVLVIGIHIAGPGLMMVLPAAAILVLALARAAARLVRRRRQAV